MINLPPSSLSKGLFPANQTQYKNLSFTAFSFHAFKIARCWPGFGNGDTINDLSPVDAEYVST